MSTKSFLRRRVTRFPASAPELAIVVAVALATTLAPLNSTMIAVALPHIMQDFQADTASAGWLITSYLIVMAAVQPIAGKLGDRFGRRRMILGGLIAFALASLGAAVSRQSADANYLPPATSVKRLHHAAQWHGSAERGGACPAPR